MYKYFLIKHLSTGLNMNKLIIFDLDGVLLEAKEIHFKALNSALEEINPELVISWEEHLRSYDGLKTYDKLKLLSLKKHTSLILTDETLLAI